MLYCMNIKNVVRFIFVSIAIGYSNIIVAQEAVIHGRVMSADGAPLEFIHVVALSRPDSTYLKSALTNKEGCFELKEESDNYFLRFSFLGYKSVDAIPKDGMVITMVEDVQNLDEVVVTASRLQYKPAGFSYSFKNDHQTSGRKAIDIIGMLPNVSYDPGNISILGRAVSAIYIGNMRSDIKEVEALRADQIEKVEIDYSSVGSEDVTSLGGVLRITLKSIEKNGLRGVLTGEGNYYPYYGIIDGNIYNSTTTKVDKLSINNNIFLSYNRPFSDYENTQMQNGEPTVTTFEKFRNNEAFIYDRLRLSYEISDKSVLSLSGFYSYLDSNPKNTTSFLDSDRQDIVTEIENKAHTAQALINYSHSQNNNTFDLSGDYLWKGVSGNTNFEHYKAFSNKLTNMVRVRPVYKHQLVNQKSELTVGGDFQMIDVGETTSDNVVPADMRSYTPALYSSYQGSKGMMMYSLGLRYQYNWLSTTQGNDTYIHRFGSLYPSLSFQYVINPQKGHMLMLQSERGASQIPYSAISGYRQYESAKLYTIGNPDLNTPIVWQNMLMMQLWKQLNLSAMYILIKSPIGFVTEVDPIDDSVFYTQPRNGNYQSVLALGAEWNKKVNDIWQMKLSSSFSLQNAHMGYIMAKNQQLWKFAILNSFNLSKSMGGGFNVRYEPESRYLDRILKPVYSFNGYFFKTFIDGTLELRADALFYNKPRVITTENDNLRLTEANKTQGAFVKVSVTYNFSRGKKFKTSKFSNMMQSYEQIEDTK